MTATAARHARPASAARPRPADLVLRVLPGAAATAAGVAVLARYGTPPLLAVVYLGAWLVLVTVPGTLLWRFARRRTTSLLEDVAAGSALGLAVQVLVAYASGGLRTGVLPSVLWPAVVLAVSAHPRFRAVWTRRASRPWRTAHLWWLAGSVSAAFLWIGSTSFARNILRPTGGDGLAAGAVPLTSYVDMPYHQSLTAGVRSFWPLVYPYLYDEPLHYHFFVYEHLAVLAQATGIDLTWVLYRLYVLPLVALAVVLVAVLAARASGRTAAGPVAGVLATTASAVSPWAFAPDAVFAPGLLTFATFRSPTQSFGICVLLAALVAAVTALRTRDRRDRAGLLLVSVPLLLVSGGAKSTLLPIAICAFALAALVGVARRRGYGRTALLLAVGGVVAFVVVALVVIGTSTERVAIRPLALLESVPLARLLAPEVSAATTVLLLGLALAAWLLPAATAVFVLRRRPGLADPGLLVLVGVVVAGVCGALLTRANGVSQLYFLYGAWPAVVVLLAWGLVEAARRVRLRPAAVAAAAAGGLAVVLLVGTRTGSAPDEALAGARATARALLPGWFLVLSGLLVVTAAATALCRGARRSAGTRAVALALLLATLVGAATATRARELGTAVAELRGPAAWQGEGVVVAPDLADAARVVRDASDPDDVVATNRHCFGAPEACDARQFSVSALSERRVLVEGWAYPDGKDPDREWSRTNPFWDEQRYAENEVVFSAPTEASLDHLRDAYGVRWLVVDRTVAAESPELARYADLVWETPGAAVYAVPD